MWRWLGSWVVRWAQFWSAMLGAAIDLLLESRGRDLTLYGFLSSLYGLIMSFGAIVTVLGFLFFGLGFGSLVSVCYVILAIAFSRRFRPRLLSVSMIHGMYYRRMFLNVPIREKKRMSLSVILALDKMRRSAICVALTFTLIAGKWFEAGLLETVNDWGVILSLMFLVCVILDNVLVYVRVSRGAFGTTEAEARELISYILRNSDKFEGGEGGFKIFEDKQSERQLAEEIYGDQAWGLAK